MGRESPIALPMSAIKRDFFVNAIFFKTSLKLVSDMALAAGGKSGCSSMPML